MRFAETIDGILAGRTYVRTDEDGFLRRCYFYASYDHVVFRYCDQDRAERAQTEDGPFTLAPLPEDLTADDWELEGDGDD